MTEQIICPPEKKVCSSHCEHYKKCKVLHDKEMEDHFTEVMDEAHALWDPFDEFIKTCPSHSWSPFCNHPPPYDYIKDGRPYNRCLKDGGYCKFLECPDYKAWLSSKKETGVK